MKPNKYEIIITIITLFLLTTLFRLIINNNKKLDDINNLYKKAQDTITNYRNDLGQQVSKISVLECEKESYFLAIKSKDEEILQLQKIVRSESKKRHDVETAIVFKNNTICELRDSLQNKIIGYTKDSAQLYPIYEKSISDEWIDENIRLGKDTFAQKLVVKNSYEIVIGNEPDGWFKKKLFGEITNLNPNSATTTMKVYQKKKVKNKTLIRSLEVGIISFCIGLIVK